MRVLTHDAGGMRAARVEISQVGAVPLLKWLVSLLQVLTLRTDEVFDDVLDGGLSSTIGVGWSDRAMFRNRNHVLKASGVAVDGRGGREDDVCDVMLFHGAEKGDGTPNIYTVVFERDFGGFTNSLVRRSATWYRRSIVEQLALSAAKWMTLSIVGCASKTLSRPGSSVRSTL